LDDINYELTTGKKREIYINGTNTGWVLGRQHLGRRILLQLDSKNLGEVMEDGTVAIGKVCPDVLM
jgi:hypothetical protein